MKKIDWYIIKNFLVTFIFAILLFIAITVVIDFSEKADDFVKSNLGFAKIFSTYYFGFIPHITALLFPLFVFIAVIFFTSKMAERSEIVAILASGVTYKRWLQPYLIAGIFIGSILWLASAFVVPNANRMRTAFEAKYIDANSSYENLTKSLNNRGNAIYVKLDSFTYAGIYNYDSATKTSSTCFGYTVKNDKVISCFRADKLIWDAKPKKWKIENVVIRTIDSIKETIVSLPVKILNFNSTPDDLYRGKYTKDILTTPFLNRYIDIEQKRGSENVNELLVERGRRNATPVTVVLLTLIGAIVAGKKVRGGSGSHLAIGFVIAALFILTDKFSTIFSTKGNFPPTIAVWIPNIIFCFVTLYLYKKAPK
jgi:lipopolysaccharide export system permease protein